MSTLSMPKPVEKNPQPRAWHFTPDRRVRFLSAIASGASEQGACNYAGISIRTYRWWMEWGNPDNHTPEERYEFINLHWTQGYTIEDYEAFYEEVIVFLGTVEVTAAEQLQLQGNRDYRASVELLSRRFPKEWAPAPQRVEQETKVTHDFATIAEGVRAKLLAEPEIIDVTPGQDVDGGTLPTATTGAEASAVVQADGRGPRRPEL